MYVAATRARDRLILSGAVKTDRWPDANPRGAPLSWLGPAIDPDIAALTPDDPVHEVRARGAGWELHARVGLNAPGTGGRVLRDAALPSDAAGGEPVERPAPMPPLAPIAGEAAI